VRARAGGYEFSLIFDFFQIEDVPDSNCFFNRIPDILRYAIIILRVYFTSKKHAIKKIFKLKKMTVFSILK
jgi:hypothetical protein